jgi:transposase
MLSLPSAIRIFLCREATDLRKGFDTLAARVREVFGRDPLSGHLFVFPNRRRNRVKLLYWDRDGYAIWYKRLERGTFCIVPGQAGGGEIDRRELAMLLEGVDLRTARTRKRFELYRLCKKS